MFSLADSDEDSKPPALTPNERLCNVLAMKLEHDMEKEKTAAATSAPPPPAALDQPTHKYLVSSFPTIQDVLQLIGTPDEQLLDKYAAKLIDYGFDTPELLLGVKKEYNLLMEMGFRVGHAVKFLKVIDRFVNDLDV